MSHWEDVLLRHADQLRPAAVISPTMDAAIVDAAHEKILKPMHAEKWPHEYTAELVVQFLQEQVAEYRTQREREIAEFAEVRSSVRGISPRAMDDYADPDFDPTDDELAAMWGAPGEPHAHQVAATLMRRAEADGALEVNAVDVIEGWLS